MEQKKQQQKHDVIKHSAAIQIQNNITLLQRKIWNVLLANAYDELPIHSILKFFQVDMTGIVRMTSYARYCKEGVDARRPNWRGIMCFLERPEAKTSCKACVQRLRCSCGSSDDTARE